MVAANGLIDLAGAAERSRALYGFGGAAAARHRDCRCGHVARRTAARAQIQLAEVRRYQNRNEEAVAIVDKVPSLRSKRPLQAARALCPADTGARRAISRACPAVPGSLGECPRHRGGDQGRWTSRTGGLGHRRRGHAAGAIPRSAAAASTRRANLPATGRSDVARLCPRQRSRVADSPRQDDGRPIHSLRKSNRVPPGAWRPTPDAPGG